MERVRDRGVCAHSSSVMSLLTVVACTLWDDAPPTRARSSDWNKH